MGLLEELVPLHSRGAKNVFIADEEGVFPRIASVDSKTTMLINDSEQLQGFLDEKSGRVNAAIPSASNGIFVRLFGSIKLKFSGVEVDLARALFAPTLSRTLGSYDNYIIQEDNIRPAQFAELFEIFSATPPHARPCILIVSKATGSRLIEKLNYVPESLDFIDVRKGPRPVIPVPRSPPENAGDYLDLYARGVYHAVVRSKLENLLEDAGLSPDPVRDMAAKIVHIHARLMTEERHHVQPAIDELLRQIEIEPAYLERDIRDDWYRLRCYLLLQKTYCSEMKRPLDQAMAIATSLGDEFASALCMRFAQILDVEPKLEQHMLSKAADIFMRHGCTELYFYCENNRRASAFSYDFPKKISFDRLCDEIDNTLPSLHRKHDIFYNYGVEMLFDAEYDTARGIFSRVRQSDARPLIKVSANLALLILSRLDHASVTPSDIIELLSELNETVDRANVWHRTNLALNALVL